MTTVIRTVSGATKELPDWLDPTPGSDPEVLGLDQDGRIVVHHDWMGDAHAYGLTLCCNAYDKGVEHGVVCRACYGDESGNYLFWKDDNGQWLGLDPVVREEAVSG